MVEDIVRTSLLEAIKYRRSLRRFRPDPVSRELIEQLLTAAIWAPSAHNRQPWRFAIIQRAGQKGSLAQAMGAQLRRDLEADHVPEAVIEKDVNRSYHRITSVPVLIVLCLSLMDMDEYPDEKRSRCEHIMAVQSVAMAGQNLLLAAHDAGLGACWMCAPLFCPDVVRSELGLSDDWQPQGLVALGYPAEERGQKRRRLEESVIWL